jgi:hypothetical protein
MKMGTGIQVILRFCPRNLKGSNIIIINISLMMGGIEVRCLNGLTWNEICTKFQNNWLRHLSNM